MHLQLLVFRDWVYRLPRLLEESQLIKVLSVHFIVKYYSN